jgi:hypothetical protein
MKGTKRERPGFIIRWISSSAIGSYVSEFHYLPEYYRQRRLEESKTSIVKISVSAPVKSLPCDNELFNLTSCTTDIGIY